MFHSETTTAAVFQVFTTVNLYPSLPGNKLSSLSSTAKLKREKNKKSYLVLKENQSHSRVSMYKEDAICLSIIHDDDVARVC